MSVPERFPGIRIAPPDERGILLFDGDCGFCARAARWFRSHARIEVGVEPVEPYLATLPPPVAATAQDQVLWISPAGEVLGGSRAVTEALRASGHPWQARLLKAAQPLTRQAYCLIARHRPASACLPKRGLPSR